MTQPFFAGLVCWRISALAFGAVLGSGPDEIDAERTKKRVVRLTKRTEER